MFTNAHDFDGQSDRITIAVDGFAVTATLHRDHCADAPWERADGHGPVSDWTRRPKRPGELVLCEDRGSRRFYDFAAACRLALAEGWGTAGGDPTLTPRQRATMAASADFVTLQDWCADGWHYVGVAVTVARLGVTVTGEYDHALWGIAAGLPGSAEYLLDVANELLPDALAAARAMCAALATPA